MTEDTLLVLGYGEGGHRAQARRLLAAFAESGVPMPGRVISLTDVPGIALDGTEEIALAPLRRKHARPLASIVHAARALLQNIGAVRRVHAALRGSDRVLLVSLGPSFVFVPALVIRLCGGIVVHIETWSRFSSRSFTGRIMHVIAHHFLVQAESLLPLYRRARFVGRL